MNDVTKCPRCGADQPVGSKGGVCPRCAAGLLQATQTDIPGEGAGSFTPPTVEELAAKFPQLEILGLIGRGGMGAVYQARQKELDRLVALKILPPDIGRDAAFAERFTREARALAKLNHPGIVTIYDFGRADGLYFFLMEFVDGMNLRELLHRQRISSREALAIVPQICDALQFAHDQGIVHRDIKPENLLIDRRGRVKVADFGLAKLIGTEPDPASPADSPAGSPTLTEAGKVMGTPNYMSPEQLEHPEEVDHRADIYALGVVFYQMLTGELPEKQLQPPSRKVQIDVRLDEVVLRALEKQPDRRYQQASTMKLQVETIAQGPAGEVPSNAARVNQGVDYKSKATLFGLPWLHVATGQDPLTGRARIARGIFAIGGVAQGVVACGGVAMGGITLGGLSLGVFSYGGLAIGLLAFGGLGVGLVGAIGGLAVAPVALGAEAIGWLAAGAKAIGTHVLDVAGSDPVARNFFNPWSKSFLKNAYIANYYLVVLTVLLASVLPAWLAWRSRVKEPRGNRVPNQPLPPGNVEAWLAFMDQGDYAGNWAAASVYFQRAMRREEWVRRGETIRRPLGRVLSRELSSTQYKYLGTRVEVKYNTVFEGLAAAVETVTFHREPNGEWKSIGYLIKPAENPRPDPGGFPAGTAGPITARQLREAYSHMTAKEKQGTWAFSAFYAIWNSATFFLPMACLMFFPLPVPVNWIIATAVLMTGLAFYPLWWKHQARVVCSSAWAQAQGWRPESVRTFPWGSTGLMLAGVLWLALVGLIWWQDYRPEGVWQPWLAEASLKESSAGGTACVREVRQYGQCLWLRMSCDPLPRSAVLTPALTGPLIELPYHLPAEATNVDCLITTAPHSTGKVIAGNYVLSGKTNFTVGFMLPDDTAAAAAVKLIRRLELGRPQGMDGALFALRRTLGKDANGKQMAEDIFGSLQLQGRPATKEAHSMVYYSRSVNVAATNQSESLTNLSRMSAGTGDGQKTEWDGPKVVNTQVKADQARNIYFLGLTLAMVLGVVVAVARWKFRSDRLALRTSPRVTIGLAVIGSLLLVLILGSVWVQVQPGRDQRNPLPLADQPFELKKRPTAEVIQAGLSKPEAPWAWQELQARLSAGDFKQAEANQLTTDLTTRLRLDYPHGYDQPLYWMGTLLDDLNARHLLTDTNAVALLDAYAGSPWLEPLPRLREHAGTLQLTCHLRSPWNNGLFGYRLLNEMRGFTIDGQPVVEDESFGRGWDQQEYMGEIKLPGLLPGKHILTCEAQCAWVDDNTLEGLAPGAPATDWPPALFKKTTPLHADFIVYAKEEVMVGLSDDPALNPVATGVISIKQVMIRPQGGHLRAFVPVTVAQHPSVPVSVKVTLELAGQVVPCGSVWAEREASGTHAQSMDERGGEVGSLDQQIKEADVVLTPNPEAVESRPGIDRIWGKDIRFSHVPLTRLDLPQDNPGH